MWPRPALRVARRRGLNARRAVLVGGGEPATEILAALQRRPDVGVQVLGMVGDKEGDGPAAVPFLGRFEDLRAVLDEQDVDLVIVALPHADYTRVGDRAARHRR